MKKEYRQDFEIFKSNICHSVKRMGDIKFLISVLKSNKIQVLFKKEWYLECFYLLAMVDFLSRENNIPICIEYDYIRKNKLEKPVFSSGIITKCIVFKDEAPKLKSITEAIPEFKHFNIMEADIRNVY
ncbi:MAG: hypothetical protein FWD13_10495 [Treponema sp.]|nr:hypothetical protein [Treponema sp.]